VDIMASTARSIRDGASASTGETVRAVERAADILAFLARAETPTGVVEMERGLGLSRPTLYRLLHTLEGKGLVRSVGEPQRFMLGFGVVELARAWLGRASLRTVAEPVLDWLWRETRETVALLTIGDDRRTRVCVFERPSPEALVFTRGAGWVEGLTVGASGKAILAHMNAAEREALIAAVGIADRAALDAALAEVRRLGYGASSAAIIEGAASLAAPVFDENGAVSAAVSLFGPQTRLVGAHRERCIQALLRGAREISAAAGCPPGKAGEEREDG
jgi:DNA-binding IclR family transcriptional regulator